jgi:hypothetical protein
MYLCLPLLRKCANFSAVLVYLPIVYNSNQLTPITTMYKKTCMEHVSYILERYYLDAINLDRTCQNT